MTDKIKDFLRIYSPLLDLALILIGIITFAMGEYLEAVAIFSFIAACSSIKGILRND